MVFSTNSNFNFDDDHYDDGYYEDEYEDDYVDYEKHPRGAAYGRKDDKKKSKYPKTKDFYIDFAKGYGSLKP